jgi:hypothetical protein
MEEADDYFSSCYVLYVHASPGPETGIVCINNSGIFLAISLPCCIAPEAFFLSSHQATNLPALQQSK